MPPPPLETRPEPPADEPPRKLWGSPVLLERKRGRLRLSMPAGGIALLLSGLSWTAVCTVVMWEPIRRLVPAVLAVCFLPPAAMLAAAALKMGRRITFELGRDTFTVSGLGYFGRKRRSWPREDVAAVLARDTNLTVNDVPQVKLVVKLRSGKEVVLLRSGDGLSLGHIAVFLAQELKRPAAPGAPEPG